MWLTAPRVCNRRCPCPSVETWPLYPIIGVSILKKYLKPKWHTQGVSEHPPSRVVQVQKCICPSLKSLGISAVKGITVTVIDLLIIVWNNVTSGNSNHIP